MRCADELLVCRFSDVTLLVHQAEQGTLHFVEPDAPGQPGDLTLRAGDCVPVTCRECGSTYSYVAQSEPRHAITLCRGASPAYARLAISDAATKAFAASQVFERDRATLQDREHVLWELSHAMQALTEKCSDGHGSGSAEARQAVSSELFARMVNLLAGKAWELNCSQARARDKQRAVGFMSALVHLLPLRLLEPRP